MILIFAAAASPAGSPIALADSPGSYFMDFDDSSAVVVSPPSDQARARISGPPSTLSEEVAAAIADGVQPLGPSIILAYHGQLYIVLDKQLAGSMASERAVNPAPRAGDRGR
jgi:hypothetical protein